MAARVHEERISTPRANHLPPVLEDKADGEHQYRGVDVSPADQRVDPGGSGILRFEVQVKPGASGEVKARTRSGDTGSTLFGPVVESDDVGWTFRGDE